MKRKVLIEINLVRFSNTDSEEVEVEIRTTVTGFRILLNKDLISGQPGLDILSIF